MASSRDIKRRIKSVHSTQQITKAMKLVATSGLQKARVRLEETHPFFITTQNVIASIVNNISNIKHPFLDTRNVEKIAIIVIAGDRGLCGGYNSNISKAALEVIEKSRDASVIAVGTKSRDFFKRRGKNVIKEYTGISLDPTYEDASTIGGLVLDLYKNLEVDEVYLAYTSFKSVISHEPTITRLLPVDTSAMASHKEESHSKGPKSTVSFEPSEETVLDYVIPKYINTVIFGALVESGACELGARMTSMDSATENAEEIIDDLTIEFNRARQGAITQELTEIVSGANALN